MKGAVYVGLHFGRQTRQAALCVVERERRTVGAKSTTHISVRHLERLPVGSTYIQVARRLGEIQKKLKKREKFPVFLVDVTGLGLPLIETLTDEGEITPPYPVYLSSGDQRHHDLDQPGGQKIRLGKALLVTELQTLLQAGRLHLPRSPEAEKLAVDLLEYELDLDVVIKDTPGGFSIGSRDDLITALGLAIQEVLLCGIGFP
jgi:hypothetical protein